MLEPIIQRLSAIGDPRVANELYTLLKPIVERFRTSVHSTAGLVIKTGGSALAKTGAAVCHYSVKGKNRSIAAGVDMTALSGTVVAATHNIYVFTVDSAGTVFTTMGTAGATAVAVTWPKLNFEHAILGYIKINPTGTGNFVGGTTALDDGTVAPNALYISVLGVMFPGAFVD